MMSSSIQAGNVKGNLNPRRKGVDGSRVWFWANECKYEVILDRVRKLGWRAVEDEKHESKCNLYWVDISAIHERMRSLLAWQTINHFPGMPNIARKNRMGQNLNRMQKIFPVTHSSIHPSIPGGYDLLC